MERAHIKGALVGVESVTPEGLKDVYKGFNFSGEELVARLRVFSEHGVHVLGSFIFGLPSDRRETFDATAALAAARRRDLCAVRDADAVSRHRGFREVGTVHRASGVAVAGVPLTRHWLIPQANRPKVYSPHPTMTPDEIRERTQGVWDRFYRFPRSGRARAPSGPGGGGSRSC